MVNKPRPVINEAGWEHAGLFKPGQEDPVTFPQVQLVKPFIGYPVQFALGRVDELAPEVSDGEDENVPVVAAIESGEGDHPVQPPAQHLETGFLPDLALHALLR